MKTKELTEELQTAYQDMVDIVEDLVIKEGKNVQQALDIAEEKLNESKQFSKYEIHQISSDLKDNFRLLGETVESANKAYKDEIKLNMSFVNDSIWDKVLNIADTNTDQLIDFAKTLKEKAHAIITTGHLTAHQEHEKWESEHEQWLSEVDSWRAEHEEGMAKLKEIEKAMEQQSLAFTEHVQVIQAHNENDQEHETILMNTEDNASSDVNQEIDADDLDMHQEDRQVHVQHKELHHTLKAHHLKLMAIINMLHRKIYVVD